jgi:Mrp family chromosome partitioning ATPase/predicted Fe-Mo cluster-binding NifX family protein
MSLSKSCGAKPRDQEHQEQDERIKEALGHIAHKVLVMSGKGGVGKSSVAAYLAVSLADRGYRVGLMDVDLHGPSIPRLLGLDGTLRPGSVPGTAKPIKFLPNLDVISIESLMGPDKDVATIWRGPLKIGVIRQFISDIDWGDLDYLVIDSPPGTGDEPLTVAQTIPDAQALIVTTPQEISLADVRKSINFCRHVNMRMLGLLENMSGLLCPHCGKEIDLFKTNGGMITAKKEGLRFLGRLPIDPAVVEKGDMGAIGRIDKESQFNKAFSKVVDAVVEGFSESKVQQPPMETARPKDAAKVIAVPLEGGRLCAHFGHCAEFALFRTKDGMIIGSSKLTPPPHEPGVIPKWLADQGADVVLAGGIGARAKEMLSEKGIEVVVGVKEGEAEKLVMDYLAGTITTGDNACDH